MVCASSVTSVTKLRYHVNAQGWSAGGTYSTCAVPFAAQLEPVPTSAPVLLSSPRSMLCKLRKENYAQVRTGKYARVHEAVTSTRRQCHFWHAPLVQVSCLRFPVGTEQEKRKLTLEHQRWLDQSCHRRWAVTGSTSPFKKSSGQCQSKTWVKRRS